MEKIREQIKSYDDKLKKLKEEHDSFYNSHIDKKKKLHDEYCEMLDVFQLNNPNMMVYILYKRNEIKFMSFDNQKIIDKKSEYLTRYHITENHYYTLYNIEETRLRYLEPKLLLLLFEYEKFEYEK